MQLMNWNDVKGKDALFRGVSPEFLWNGLVKPGAFSLVTAKILAPNFMNMKYE
jgi:hypothetical protein